MSLIERIRSAARQFILGPAVVDDHAAAFGVDSSKFSPEEYGNYIATSNAVYTCATLRAQRLASLPLRLYKLRRNGEREEVTSGQLWQLIHKVNDFWTFSRWIEMTELSLCLWGKSFTFLERGKSGRLTPQEMWWGRPDRVKVFPDPINYVGGFEYKPQGVAGDPVGFTPQETFWLRYPNPLNEYEGLSPLAAARISADFGTAAMQANDKMFRNGIQLAGAVFPEDEDGSFTPEQAKELERLLERRFQGYDKAHRWAVFRYPMKMQQLGWSPKDAEMLGGLKWSLEEVCRAYKVPLDLVGGQRTYENYESAQVALWSMCIIPEGRFISDELTEQLLPMFPGQADLVEFDHSGVQVLQGDRGALVDQIVKLAQQGVPLNTLLQEFMPELLPPNGAGYAWGDVWWASGALKPIRDAEEEPEPIHEEPDESEPPQDDNEDEEEAPNQEDDAERSRSAAESIPYGSPEHERIYRAFRAMTEEWEDCLAGEIALLFARLRASIKDRLANKDPIEVAGAPFDRARWAKVFRASIKSILAEMATKIMDDEAGDLGAAPPDMNDPEIERMLENRSQFYADRVLDTTWSMLIAALSAGIVAGEGPSELAGRVDEVMDEREGGMVTIAGTIAAGVANAALLVLWLLLPNVVRTKTWISMLDERVRPTHQKAHGQTVGVNEDFVVGNGRGPAPGQIGLPEEDINCRCTIRPGVKLA